MLLLFFLEMWRPTTHFAGQLGLFARGSVKPATTAAKPDEPRAYIYYYSRALLTPTHPPPIATALPLPSVIVFVLLAPGAALRRIHPTPPPPLTPSQPKPLPFTFAPKIYPSTSSTTRRQYPPLVARVWSPAQSHHSFDPTHVVGRGGVRTASTMTLINYNII